MATIEVTYDYPYPGYGDYGRFQTHWAETQSSLNGSYTSPMCFNNFVPRCTHLKIDIEITNTGSGTIYDRSWDFLVHKNNGTWITIERFTLPDTGLYTVDCDIDELDIDKIAFVPTSNPGTSRTWENWYEIQQITLTENLVIHDLQEGMFQYGVFVNYNHLEKKKIKNEGQKPKYYVTDNHEPIVSRELFYKAQERYKQIQEHYYSGKKITKTVFSSMIVCENCGKSYKRVTNNGRVFWNCSTYFEKGKSECFVKRIPESTLEKVTAEVLGLKEFKPEEVTKQIEKIQYK